MNSFCFAVCVATDAPPSGATAVGATLDIVGTVPVTVNVSSWRSPR